MPRNRRAALCADRCATPGRDLVGGDFREPVGRVGRNDDHVARADLSADAALYGAPARARPVQDLDHLAVGWGFLGSVIVPPVTKVALPSMM